MELEITENEIINLNTFSSDKGISTYIRVGFCPTERVMIKKYLRKRRAKILDLGCGVGRTTVPLHDMGLDVIGADISEEMIKKAKSMYPNMDFRVENASDMTFPDRSFDYVLFSFNGLDYIYPEEKRIKALREVYRVLKDGGIFMFSGHNPMQFISRGILSCLHHWYWLSRFIINNILRRCLFSKYKIEKLKNGELVTYYINPLKQREQLENNAFKLLDIIGRYKGRMKYFEPWLYYVAQK